MGQKVIWANSAYIHRDSPAYAASFVTRTLQTARSLSDFPERGRRIPEIRHETIREVFIRLVAIDLKIGAFQPGDKGQMD